MSHTTTFDIIDCSALPDLRWLDLAGHSDNTMTFSLKIEVQILLSHWDHRLRTFRRPSIALKLSRSRNLCERNQDRLADAQSKNAIDLIKDVFTQQIAVTTYNKIFSNGWNSPTLPCSNQETGGWVVEENNMFQQGSRASAVFELPACPSYITTHHARTAPATPYHTHHELQHQQHLDQPICTNTPRAPRAHSRPAPSLNTDHLEGQNRSRRQVRFDIPNLPAPLSSAPLVQPALPLPSAPRVWPVPLPSVPHVRPVQGASVPRTWSALGPSVRSRGSPIVIVESETETETVSSILEQDSEQDNRCRDGDANVPVVSQHASRLGTRTNTEVNSVPDGAPPPYCTEPGTPVLQEITGVQGTYSVTIDGVMHLIHVDLVRN
ncbi:hypothetical protein F4604DRAFT_1933798 [Suillus subluteus]|nr:hypothetical protein F4604DRAFT_1933798 [Suillus subluteus]